MARKRPERRDSYHDFPPSYAELLQKFSKLGSVRLGPMPRKDALALQANIYRFAGFLRNAPPDDAYAAELSEIAGRMKCRRVVNPIDLDTVTLELYEDPLIDLMANLAEEEEEQPT